MSLTVVTEPQSEPIELEEAKHQITQDVSIDFGDDEKIENIWIPAARDRCEIGTFSQLITATYDLFLRCFPGCGVIELPRPPLQSVTWVKYVDANGDLQTWDDENYLVDAPRGKKARRGRIMPAHGVTWPSTRPQWNAVQVRFVCGYGDTGTEVPALLRHAMLLDIGSMFVHREQVVMDAATEVVLEIPDGSKAIYRTFSRSAKARYLLPED